MKFGKQLQLGRYEPWKEQYIKYDKLKRIISRRKFLKDKKQAKAEKVAKKMEKALPGPSSESTPLASDMKGRDDSGGYSGSSGVASHNNDDNEEAPFFPVILAEMDKISKFYVGKLAELRIILDELTSRRANAYHSHHTGGGDQSELTKLRDLYIQLTNLRSYCDLNKTGFLKIIKKYDKIMEEDTLKVWKKTVEGQAFAAPKEPGMLIEVVAGLVSRDKLLQWERFANEQQYKTDDDIFPAVRLHGLIIAFIVLAASLFLPVVPENDPCARRCMSLLLFVVTLWITEAIPYFATGLLVPALVPLMSVLKASSSSLDPMSVEEAAEYVLNHIFNNTTMLLIGGYTISSAFARCQLELRIAAWMQKHFRHPATFILAIMFLGLFLSMWISNHTAPILCAAIILPIVRDLPADSRFSKALLLGLAYACNFGGMMTPISSLQNVLAVQYLEQSGISVSFGRWLFVSIPFCTLCVLISWLWLLLIVRPDDISAIPIIVYERENKVLGKRNIMVIVLSLSTILLFAAFNPLKDVLGNIGIVALCFVVTMFGSGILTEVDFNSLPWHTLFLIGGGSVLGKAVQSSGLLNYISDGILHVLPLGHPWLALTMILGFCVTIATFVSHTVASLILMPIISHVGITLQMPEEAVIGSAMAVSAAMALPFSSFPNVNSLLLVDDFQQTYLTVGDFVKTGLPLSILTVFLIATLGFFLIRLIVASNAVPAG